MDKRFILWFVLSAVLLGANAFVIRWMQPDPPPAVAQKDGEKDGEKDEVAAGDKPLAADGTEKKAADKPAGDADTKAAIAATEKPADAATPGEAEKPAANAENPDQAKPNGAPAPVVEHPRQLVTLGSGDPQSPFRELVTLTTSGAAVVRVELNSLKYLDQQDRSGYFGHLELSAAPNGAPQGAVVNVVPPGTPAAAAGVRAPDLSQNPPVAGDLIVELNGQAIAGPSDVEAVLEKTEPDTEFTIVVQRDGKPVDLSGTLRRRPMEVIRPENFDPYSFLLTLDTVDDARLSKEEKELPGLRMRTANWQLLPRTDPDEAVFAYDATDYGLKILKRYRLAKVDPADAEDPAAAAYHLEFDVEVVNLRNTPRKVALRLDGPTGLPREGASYKISPNWRGGAGMRDVVVGFFRNKRTEFGLVSATTIAGEKKPTPWQDEPIEYLGVDTQYYAVVLLPTKANPEDVDYAQAMAIVAGSVPEDARELNRTDVTFRWIGKTRTVPAATEQQVADGKPLVASEPLVQKFRVFAGPKQSKLLAEYQLQNLIYYGWSIFGWVAERLRVVLYVFYRIIPNYGVAIVLLTVLVRSMLFPLSRKQALNAQKMQELQPEIKKIQEKYKGNMEARTKAQQELFRKHSYNPLAGCLPVFLQLPIFIGLYRCLSVDSELNGAPLISRSIRWCSNLAAPDMLWYWKPYLPDFLAGPHGWLGPYFNLLPCITIALFLWQQKMFLPPPTDEQSAMQQKVMKYMMVFVGFMFFKVPSGLCLYFIASSLWGIAERKLLPKAKPITPGGEPAPVARLIAPRAGENGNGKNGKKKKNRGRA